MIHDDGSPVRRPQSRDATPPCRARCPSGTDVRGWVTMIAQRRKLGLSDEEAYRRAWESIVDVNPFPAVMGRICPHPCESGCNRVAKDGAVSVNRLERFLGDWALERGLALPRGEGNAKPESMGVLGAGPAGLSFAYQMARRGYRVTVYERYPKPGGMLRYGIPRYRLPESVLDGEIRRILDLGVELHTHVRVGRDVTVEDLQRRHDILFLGIGAHQGRKLGVPGEDGPGVWGGTDYLALLHGGGTVSLGRKVVVVGGGDTAIDAARAARRHGSDVTILYRRTRDEMPAIASEVDEALEEGIRLEWLVAPVEIVRENGMIRRIVVRRTELGDPDESGRRRPVPVAGSETSIPVDSVVAAISQEPDWRNLEQLRADGPGGEQDGPLHADALGQVGERRWAGGDVLGLGIASLAIGRGRLAAESVHAQLRGLPPPDPTIPEPIGTPSVKLDSYEEKSRVSTEALPVERRLAEPHAEIHPGLREDQFLNEVTRCLSCGHCFGCETCWMYCAHGCFSHVEEIRPGRYFVLALDHCQACGKCVDVCPCGFLQLRGDERG